MQIISPPSAHAGRVVMLVVVIMGLNLAAVGQSADEIQVKAVLAQLFRGMEFGDSAMVHKCFVSDPAMVTVRTNKEGKTILARDGKLSGFLNAVGTPHAETWYEETWNVKVQIDGQLAQVWCDFAFYRGHKFSHCGVDAFHLFKEGGEWKIFHLADTRRTADCAIPADISKKHTP